MALGAGLTFSQLLSGNPPFSDRKMDLQIVLAVLSGIRPPRPEDCPDWLWTTIEKCWREESGSRLTASEVATHLVEMATPTVNGISDAIAPNATQPPPPVTQKDPPKLNEAKPKRRFHVRDPVSDSNDFGSEVATLPPYPDLEDAPLEPFELSSPSPSFDVSGAFNTFPIVSSPSLDVPNTSLVRGVGSVQSGHTFSEPPPELNSLPPIRNDTRLAEIARRRQVLSNLRRQREALSRKRSMDEMDSLLVSGTPVKRQRHIFPPRSDDEALSQGPPEDHRPLGTLPIQSASAESSTAHGKKVPRVQGGEIRGPPRVCVLSGRALQTF